MKIDINDKAQLRTLIMSHYEHPKKRGHQGNGEIYSAASSVCSDSIVLEIKEKNDVIQDIRFEGQGCAIALAAADALCEVVAGKTQDEVKTIAKNYQALTMHQPYDEAVIGPLIILHQMVRHKSRVACAQLPLYALENFLKK